MFFTNNDSAVVGEKRTCCYKLLNTHDVVKIGECGVLIFSGKCPRMHGGFSVNMVDICIHVVSGFPDYG